MPASLRRRPDKVRNAARQRSGSLLLCCVPLLYKEKKYVRGNRDRKTVPRKDDPKNVSFRANPRECIGIVGGNGCGKTTLLSILAGIRKPDRGSIRIDGQEALGRHRLLEEKIAYVPQENPLIPS